jgi:hypothetical protein
MNKMSLQQEHPEVKVISEQEATELTHQQYVEPLKRFFETPVQYIVAPVEVNLTMESTAGGPALIAMLRQVLEQAGAQVNVNDSIPVTDMGSLKGKQIDLSGMRINFVRSVWIHDRRSHALT